jgi:hypothetical protein
VKPENTQKKGIERGDNFTHSSSQKILVRERERVRDPSHEQLWRKKRSSREDLLLMAEGSKATVHNTQARQNSQPSIQKNSSDRELRPIGKTEKNYNLKSHGTEVNKAAKSTIMRCRNNTSNRK